MIFFTVIIAAGFNIAFAEPLASKGLPRATIEIGGHKVDVELAENPRDQAQGLMFREELKDGHGMLFVFSDLSPREFWMKNTYIPLSVAFLGADLKIFKMADMSPQPAGALKVPRVKSEKPARLVLEVPQGWFARNKIKVDDNLRVIRAPQGSLLQQMVEGSGPKSRAKGP